MTASVPSPAAAGPVLVVGATGNQGGSSVRALLARGVPVRALVRDRESAAARAVAEAGAELVVGDLGDPASLVAAAAGARAVFSVQRPGTSGPQDDQETVHGRNLVSAAVAAGVNQFVHTSVSGTGDYHRSAPGWGTGRWNEHYWESKASVEDLVRAAGFPRWTILRPAFFMENFSFYLRGNRLVTAYAADTLLALIAVRDIGVACAAAVLDPDRFHQVELELAGEVLTLGQSAEVLSAAWGQRIEGPALSADEAVAAGMPSGMVWGHEWFNVVGGQPAHPDHARALGISLTDLRTWAEENTHLAPATV